MRITNLEVVNFRSFGPSGIEFSFKEGLNTVVGENNTGKSNLIHALGTIRGLLASDPPDTLPIDTFHDQNTDIPISFRLKAIMDESDLNSFMAELRFPVQLKVDLLTLFGRDLFFDLEYSFDKNRLEKKILDIGKIRIEEGKGILIGTDPQQYKIARGWQEYVNDAKAGKTIRSQLEEHPNTIIDFGSTIDRIIGSFLFQRILVIPEYREQPRSSEPSIVAKTALTGRELPSALHSLANSADKEKRKSFEIIKDTFYKLFSTSLAVSNKPDILFTNSNQVSHESVGAGIITVLIMLTHIIGFKGNVFFVDEPELHLHPHSKRMLSAIIKEYSKDTQIISITHSTHFIHIDDIEKITLVREIKGQSELFRASGLSESLRKRLLSRVMRPDQKEFLFSRATLLVEGETEFGATPALMNKLGYDLDSHSVSVIEVGNNYFAYFMELLSAFSIPYVILCDRDTLMTISDTVEIRGQDVKTSTIIKQFDKLGKLTDDDRNIISSFSNKIININTESVYEDSCYQALVGIIQQKYRFIILSPDFEGVFVNAGQASILDQARKEYPKSKALQGKYLAEEMKSQDIPSEFNELAKELKNL